MTQEQPSTTHKNSMPTVIYILYLTSIVLGITSIIGLIMAYINKGDAKAIEATHYRYQIRTFWIGLLYAVICMLLTAIGIGFLLMFGVLIWFIIRCVKGLSAYSKNQAIVNPTTWLV